MLGTLHRFTSRSHRNAGDRLRFVSYAALITMLVTATAVAQTIENEPTPSPALCAEGDPNPEPGIQGDVPQGTSPEWDCGVTEIGYLPGANGAMAVADHCAYTGVGSSAGPGESGVRVLDVSDPSDPTLVRILETGSRELLAAHVTADRALLATRRRDVHPLNVAGQGDMLIDVWDIHDCTDPQLLGTARIEANSNVPFELAGPAHNLRFNPTATKLYGSLPPHEIDLTDLDDPSTWTVRNLRCIIVDQSDALIATVPGLCGTTSDPNLVSEGLPPISHEPVFNPDGSRLYIGAQVPGPDNNAMWILDMTGPDPVLISKTDETPGHSIDHITVDDRTYLLHSNELGGNACIPEDIRPRYVGFGDRAWILDITDETAPTEVAEIILQDSTFAACALDSGAGPNTAYHDVDDPLDTTYGVIGFGPAGFRFFDLRDPTDPTEIAYFNHGASEHTAPYIIPETGHIWVSDATGFRVLALEPQVLEHLAAPLPAGPETPGAPEATPSAVAPASGGTLPATGADPRVLLAAAIAATGVALLSRRISRRS